MKDKKMLFAPSHGETSDRIVCMHNVYMSGRVCIMLFFGLVPVPGGTLMSEELSCIVDHSCLVLLLPAHRAASPPRKPLKSLNTRPVEHVRTRQQHLKKRKKKSDISYQSTDRFFWSHLRIYRPQWDCQPELKDRT